MLAFAVAPIPPLQGGVAPQAPGGGRLAILPPNDGESCMANGA